MCPISFTVTTSRFHIIPTVVYLFLFKMFIAYSSHIVTKFYYALRLCVEILTSFLFSGPRLAANKHSVSKVSASPTHFLVNYPDYPWFWLQTSYGCKRLQEVLNCVAGEHDNTNVLLAVYTGKIANLYRWAHTTRTEVHMFSVNGAIYLLQEDL